MCRSKPGDLNGLFPVGFPVSPTAVPTERRSETHPRGRFLALGTRLALQAPTLDDELPEVNNGCYIDLVVLLVGIPGKVLGEQAKHEEAETLVVVLCRGVKGGGCGHPKSVKHTSSHPLFAGRL